MKHILILFLIFISLVTRAQNDTIFVFFEKKPPNYVLIGINHPDNPHLSGKYPFDSARIYMIPKKAGRFTKSLSFGYRSYTPEWMDQQFYYQEVDRSILEKKDFKDREWFDPTDYHDIIRYFEGNRKSKPVIMLLDENHLNDEKVYLVRVYFSYNADM